MKVLGVIPSRFGSTRFPGKPLVEIKGKSMIQRVYEQCMKAKNFDKIIVATDNQRIFNHVESFGGTVVMTSPKHPTGTDRCAEVLERFSGNYDVVVNIQGDEPLIDPGQLDLIASAFERERCQIATLVKKINTEEILFDPSKVKVVRNHTGQALYFSRAAIPYQSKDQKSWLDTHTYWNHIGIYAYKVDVLNNLSKLDPSALENAENLEQLRWMEAGYTIDTLETNHNSVSVDIPKDIDRVIAILNH
jgi:3-deoxy-manno-octulosonate cytidylyltransferase (CMP-KDO synthetase)